MAGRLGMEQSSFQPNSQMKNDLDARSSCGGNSALIGAFAIDSLPGDLDTEVKGPLEKAHKKSELGATSK